MLGPKENPSVKCNNQAAAAAAVRASERGRRVVSRSQNLKAHFISNGASLPSEATTDEAFQRGEGQKEAGNGRKASSAAAVQGTSKRRALGCMISRPPLAVGRVHAT